MARCVKGLAMAMVLMLGTPGCGADDPPPATDADRVGVGAECHTADDCLQPEPDAGPAQVCLTQFKGGYCGIEDCTANEDCPEGSACVAHTDGTNYCFRICNDKVECNLNRAPDNESNCSANIEYVDGTTQDKACVPPSG